MKCLLTGGKGNLGTELVKLSSKYNIEYITPTSKEHDITDIYSMADYWATMDRVDCVVHCAAYTNVPGAEVERQKAIKINIKGTENVSIYCNVFGVSLVYISTDYVYPGIDGNYKEDAATQPVNFYALTKLAGEAYVRNEDLIIRTSFKPRQWKYPRAFSDIYTSADFIDTIADKISILIANKANGIFNVGTCRKSVYDLAKLCDANVLPMSRNEIKDVHLPYDISMNTEKYDLFYRQVTR